MITLTCSCCGDAAPAQKQHSNRDIGYGLCGTCAAWIIGRDRADTEFERCYGLEGIHWMPLYRTLYGREFKITALFRGSHAQDCANQFMAKYEAHALLAVEDGVIYLARTDDPGKPLGRRGDGNTKHQNSNTK